MAEDTEKKAKNKKLFEDLLGHDLEEGDLPTEVVVRETIGLNAEHEAEVVSREIGTTGASTKTFSTTSAMDVAGIFRVGQSGVAKFRLSDFYGRPLRNIGREFHRPIIFTATPFAEGSVHVTAVPTLVDDNGVPDYQNDVEVEVFAWDAAGNASGPVVIQFRCLVGFSEFLG